jgi:hypothetical protein
MRYCIVCYDELAGKKLQPPGQACGARIVGFASAGADTGNLAKQANEFGAGLIPQCTRLG